MGHVPTNQKHSTLTARGLARNKNDQILIHVNQARSNCCSHARTEPNQQVIVETLQVVADNKYEYYEHQTRAPVENHYVGNSCCYCGSTMSLDLKGQVMTKGWVRAKLNAKDSARNKSLHFPKICANQSL